MHVPMFYSCLYTSSQFCCMFFCSCSVLPPHIMAAVMLWIGNLPAGVTKDELFWMVVHRFGLLPGQFVDLKLYNAKPGWTTSSCHLKVDNAVAADKVLKWNGKPIVDGQPNLDIRIARERVHRTEAISHSFMYMCLHRMCIFWFVRNMCLTYLLGRF